MRRGVCLATLPVFFVLALCASAARTAELNGPMSSAKKPETATAAPVENPPATGVKDPFAVEKLFANTCGWCHSGAGREAGRGPKLMDSALSDAEIIHRIKQGKPGAMPAFGTAFNDDEILAIVKYIRELKEQGAAK